MVQFRKDFTIYSRHLHFPVKQGSPKVILQILLNGEMVREFDLELASGEPGGASPVDWWAFYDVSTFEGQTVSVVSAGDGLPEAQAAWLAQAITQSDGIMGGEALYREALRPQFHFTPRRGWNTFMRR